MKVGPIYPDAWKLDEPAEPKPRRALALGGLR
jgi:hypothetical protein